MENKVNRAREAISTIWNPKAFGFDWSEAERRTAKQLRSTSRRPLKAKMTEYITTSFESAYKGVNLGALEANVTKQPNVSIAGISVPPRFSSAELTFLHFAVRGYARPATVESESFRMTMIFDSMQSKQPRNLVLKTRPQTEFRHV